MVEQARFWARGSNRESRTDRLSYRESDILIAHVWSMQIPCGTEPLAELADIGHSGRCRRSERRKEKALLEYFMKFFLNSTLHNFPLSWFAPSYLYRTIIIQNRSVWEFNIRSRIVPSWYLCVVV